MVDGWCWVSRAVGEFREARFQIRWSTVLSMYYAWYCTPQGPFRRLDAGTCAVGLRSLGRWLVRLTGNSNSSSTIRVTHAQVLHSKHRYEATTDEHTNTPPPQPRALGLVLQSRRGTQCHAARQEKRRDNTIQIPHLCSWHTPKKRTTTFPPEPPPKPAQPSP